MKSAFEIVKHYYKYVYTPFVQPTLTSDGTFGGNSMAVYHVFGGNNGCWGTTYTAFQPNGSLIGFYCDEWKSSMYICIYLPKPTRLTALSFYVPHTSNSSGGAYNVQLYGGLFANDRRELIRNIGNIGENSWCNVELTNANYFQYFTLYLENGGWAYEDEVELKNILFSGTCREIIDGTPEDYDFCKEENKYKVFLKDEKYKAFKF